MPSRAHADRGRPRSDEPSPGLIARMSRMPARATNNPSSPDISARVRLSASNCRTIRARLAPSAARMAISLSRLALRASERLATLVAAIRSTQKTAPVSIHKASRDAGSGDLQAQRNHTDAAVPVGCRRTVRRDAVRSRSSRPGPAQTSRSVEAFQRRTRNPSRARRDGFPNPETSCAAPTHRHRVCETGNLQEGFR